MSATVPLNRSRTGPADVGRMNLTAVTRGIERVEPQLRDLMALARPAQALPTWSKRLHSRRAGQYLSQVRGRGMEYDESRLYQNGDDIRHLDWRVTARTGKPHTKLFREEQERPVFTALDFSPAMFFGTRGVFKSVQAARIAALLAWRAQLNGDRVGGLLFAPGIHHELPPRRGQAAVVRWLKMIAVNAPDCRQIAYPQDQATLFTESLARLRRVAKPGSLVFLISDFHALDEHGRSELSRLASHTDTALALVTDRLDQEFPGLQRSGAVGDRHQTIQLGSVGEAQRQQYRSRFAERTDALRELCKEQRMLFSHITTEDDAVVALMKLFQT